MRVRTDGTVLRTGGTGSSTASALCEVARLPVDMDVWGKSTDQEVINNLRRGLMMVSNTFQISSFILVFVQLIK
jgi:hypothetical protein